MEGDRERLVADAGAECHCGGLPAVGVGSGDCGAVRVVCACLALLVASAMEESVRFVTAVGSGLFVVGV